MKSKRRYGAGRIEERSPGRFRLRYSIDGEKYAKTVDAKNKTDAEDQLRKILGAKEAHVKPNKQTVGEWIIEWLELGAPGRRRKRVSQQTLERYQQLMMTHVVPVLGDKALQQLRAPDIDKLYSGLVDQIAPRTQHHVHVVLASCLATAERTGLINPNPMLRVQLIPNAEVHVDDADDADDIGEGLTDAELASLVEGFEGYALYPIVVLASATGARRNELLALRWGDLDPTKCTLRIERALDQTKRFGIKFKSPKTKRGYRTIDIDPAVVDLLLAIRKKQQQLVAGIADGVDVDLGLIKLPPNTLMFPSLPDLTKPRNPRGFSQEFAKRAEIIGFGRIRFHDLRGIHSTALLDAGVPVHTVAQRIGDDPAVLLKSYAKRSRTKQADQKLSDAISTLTAGILKK
jgi:integrase